MEYLQEEELHRRNQLEDWFEEIEHNLYVVPPPGYNEIAPLEELIERRGQIQAIHMFLMGNNDFRNMLELSTVLHKNPDDQDAINEIGTIFAQNFSEVYPNLIQQMDSLDELVVQLAPTLCGFHLTPNVVMAQTSALECHEMLVQLLEPLDLADDLLGPD